MLLGISAQHLLMMKGMSITMAKIAPLCSSSKGNSVFVGDNSQGVLIDAGCSFKALKTALEFNGIPFEAIKAIVITHEHIDHVKALLQITKHTRLPIYASHGTAARLFADKLVQTDANIYSCDELSGAPVDIDIEYFHTPHDSAESVGYVFSWGDHRVACCTDLGQVTDEVRSHLLGCDTVYLEANYDPAMLRINTKYPPYLKARISSCRGHLSNTDSADFCSELVENGTRRLILGHLSQENNTAAAAYNAVSGALNNKKMKCNEDYTLNVAPVVTDGQYIVL